ncbi:hypothetical protein C8J57DRAFT_1494215 [Mycena rebaudengoi]|nr:hypothetical protein C8J57DRAFT_1494215 [Mycena rebaudengoi]
MMHDIGDRCAGLRAWIPVPARLRALEAKAMRSSALSANPTRVVRARIRSRVPGCRLGTWLRDALHPPRCADSPAQPAYWAAMGGLQGGARLGVVSTRRNVTQYPYVGGTRKRRALVGRLCGTSAQTTERQRARVGRRLARWAVRPRGVEADYSPNAAADVSCRPRHPTPSRSPARELVALGRARILISHTEQSEYGILTRISRPFFCIMFCAGTWLVIWIARDSISRRPRLTAEPGPRPRASGSFRADMLCWRKGAWVMSGGPGRPGGCGVSTVCLRVADHLASAVGLSPSVLFVGGEMLIWLAGAAGWVARVLVILMSAPAGAGSSPCPSQICAMEGRAYPSSWCGVAACRDASAGGEDVRGGLRASFVPAMYLLAVALRCVHATFGCWLRRSHTHFLVVAGPGQLGAGVWDALVKADAGAIVDGPPFLSGTRHVATRSLGLGFSGPSLLPLF